MVQLLIAAGLAFAAGAGFGVVLMLPPAPTPVESAPPLCLALEELPDRARICTVGQTYTAVANTCPTPTELRAADDAFTLVLEPAGQEGAEFLGCLHGEPRSRPWTP